MLKHGMSRNTRIRYQNPLPESARGNYSIFAGHNFWRYIFIQNVISFERICPSLILWLYYHKETSLFTGNQATPQSDHYFAGNTEKCLSKRDILQTRYIELLGYLAKCTEEVAVPKLGSPLRLTETNSEQSPRSL